jgi:hypothetical protein
MSATDPLDRYYTQRSTVVAICDLLWARHGLSDTADCIEPSCGSGEFVIELHKRTIGNVWACDVDPGAAGLDLADQKYLGDWCEASAGLVSQGIGFDLAVGNPPYGGPAEGRGREPGDPAYLGLHHALSAMDVAPVVAFILPWSWLATPLAMKQLRGRDPAWVYRFASRPFPKLREAALWVWDESMGNDMKIGPFINWKKRGRA